MPVSRQVSSVRYNVQWKLQGQPERVPTSNRVDGEGGESTTANSIAVAREFPEAVASVDWDIGDGTTMLCSVDVSKSIRPRLALLQVGSEERRGQSRSGVAEERLLLDRLH